MVELLVTSMLERAHTLPLNRLVARIAEELSREELRYAWVLDIGVLGNRLFVSSVAKEIANGNGSLWRIQEGEPDKTG